MSQSLGKVKKARFNSWLELPTLTSSSPGGGLSAQGSVRGLKSTLKTSNISPEAFTGCTMGEREQERKTRKGLRNPEDSSHLLGEATHRHFQSDQKPNSPKFTALNSCSLNQQTAGLALCSFEF